MARPAHAVVFFLLLTILPFPLLAAAPPAANDQAGGGLSVSATVGGMSYAGTGSRSLDPLFGVKVGYDILGKGFDDSLGVEGTVNYFPGSKNGGSSSSGYVGRVDALYYFLRSKKISPYLALGAGGMFISGDATSKGFPLVNYGLGMKYFLKESLALRADARHIITLADTNSSNNFELSLGLCYYFGKEAPKKVAPLPEKKAEKKETDKEKKQPKTVEPDDGTEPEQGAEPARGEEPGRGAEPAREATTGKETATGKTTESGIESGAGRGTKPPLPSESASADQSTKARSVPEPETTPGPPPVKSSPEGTPAGTLTIEFDFAKYDVKPEYLRKIKENADELKSSPTATAIIEGHADITGSKRYNFRLSRKRAQTVRDLFVKYGIDPKRITIKSFGSTRPIADNSTAEGRQKNRRAVEIVIVRH